MNLPFVREFLKRTQFPTEAARFVETLVTRLGDTLDEPVQRYLAEHDHVKLTPAVEELATRFGYSPHSIWLAILIVAAESAMPLYRNETYFWNTFEDLRCKAKECMTMYGVWGVFVPVWYPRFYEKDGIVRLGRLQYETRPWYHAEPVIYGDTVIRHGDPALFLHIPSDYGPFDRETRLASYREAVEYFERPLLCICNSWLLYPPYDAIFAPTSNIADFRREFSLFRTEEINRCTLWNVIGPTYNQDPSVWPETSSLQRALKTYAQNGGTFGAACGILSCDGTTIFTKNE